MKQYLIFESNNHLFALNIHSVKEIIRNVMVETLPSQPDFIEGILNFRGVFVPVVDLKKLFFNFETEIDLNKRIIIIHFKDNYLSLIVDSVKVVSSLDIEEKSKGIIDNVLVDSHYLNGVTKYNDLIVYVLNSSTILDKKQSKKIQELYDKDIKKMKND